jgi:2-octaprenylphenol hydroxylase
MNHSDVLIIGGGIVGLSAALAMADCQLNVALVDAGSLEIELNKKDDRVYAINKASQTLLERLGVWQFLDDQSISPYQNMHVWDAHNKACIDFDSRMVASPYLGHIIEETALKAALLKRINASANIRLFSGSKINSVKHLDKGIEVASEQASWNASLLMVADGPSSPTRQYLEVALNSWSYQQQALVARVHTEKPHQKTAYQVFHSNGPLAFLPLKDPYHSSIVWSVDTSDAQELMALNDDAFNQKLALNFSNRLGRCSLSSYRHQFPLTMRHAKDYVGNNWLLLGDAAHTIHPLAGLGLNLGLADVASWYRLVKENKSAIHSIKALKSYQRERKSAVWQTIVLMEGLKQIFSFSAPPVSFFRGLGLGLCNQFIPLKRLFIKHAAG